MSLVVEKVGGEQKGGNKEKSSEGYMFQEVSTNSVAVEAEGLGEMNKELHVCRSTLKY